MMNWKQLISAKRFGMEEFHEERQENRSEFQRDYVLALLLIQQSLQQRNLLVGARTCAINKKP